MGKMLPRLVREDIEVQLVPGVELWKVKADPVQVEQIVINLVVNARDAMPGAGQITVETRNVHAGPEYVRSHPTLPEGDYVVLSVRDTGVGIAPGVQARMFEPFFTTKAKGTGLGLATVYGVVKQSGGSIWVESEAGKGTLFEIYLPRTEAETQGAQAPKADTADERGCETVLLVEDEEAVRVSTSQYLLRRGYTVLQGNSGADALNKMARHPGKIDVLITDVIMPGMSGPALADDLLRRLPELRVLYISGYVDKTLEQYGITSEVFLQKPFSLAALGRKLRQVLDGGARAQEPNKELASAR
jgi:CheY-like chemotaxis protein